MCREEGGGAALWAGSKDALLGHKGLRLGFGRRDFGPGSLVLWNQESDLAGSSRGWDLCLRSLPHLAGFSGSLA